MWTVAVTGSSVMTVTTQPIVSASLCRAKDETPSISIEYRTCASTFSLVPGRGGRSSESHRSKTHAVAFSRRSDLESFVATPLAPVNVFSLTSVFVISCLSNSASVSLIAMATRPMDSFVYRVPYNHNQSVRSGLSITSNHRLLCTDGSIKRWVTRGLCLTHRRRRPSRRMSS